MSMHVIGSNNLVIVLLGTVLILAGCADPVPTTNPTSTATVTPITGIAATTQPAPSPTPVLTSTSVLTPTAVPTPSSTLTPEPQPTAKPEVVPASTALPSPTPTAVPAPSSTPAPEPQPTAIPEVIPTSTPLPSPSPTAVPTPTAPATPSTNLQSNDQRASAAPQGLFLPFRTEDVGEGNGFISPFGIIRHSRDAGHGHGGIDIPLNQDAPVYAVADGAILSVEESSDGAGGFDVKLLILGSGGEGWGFLYEHIDLEPGISVDSTVTKGQLIGRNGLTTDRRNNHLQLTYMFNDYRFYRDQRCWVDHLDASSKETVLAYFDSLKTKETFLAQWRNASEEGMNAYKELLNREKSPEGPQLCYSLGLEVRVSVTPTPTTVPIATPTRAPSPSVVDKPPFHTYYSYIIAREPSQGAKNGFPNPVLHDIRAP